MRATYTSNRVTAHPRLVRRTGGLPSAPIASVALAPEYLPSDAFEDLVTGIWHPPAEPDTVRDVSQPLPPLPKPKPAGPVRGRRSAPARVQPKEPVPQPLRRAPRHSVQEIASVRPIAKPTLSPRHTAMPAAQPAPYQPPPRAISAQHPELYEPPRPALPPYHPSYGQPLPEYGQPLPEKEEPLAFGGDVLRRAATAVEPAIGSRITQPRPILFAVTAAGLVAAAIIVLAAYKVVESRRPRPKQIALETDPVRRSDEPRLARVALSAEESSRVHHRSTAGYRDRWKANVWFHPLTGEMRLPENPTRKFGARRSGKRPTECGRGHCGIDVGDFGLSVHATRDGVIDKVQRKPHDRAGKYIRIVHDDGFISYYIHLHRIRKDLEVGMKVRGGEEIGITGKTGIRKSRPHLHFALAFRDGKEKYFVDPEPLLRRSIWSPIDADIAGAEAADADIVASGGAPLENHVQARRKD